MADKTYKMVVTLSNGSTVDAGTFVAPQGPQGARGAKGPQGPEGPQGPQGPAGTSGGLGEWTNATPNTQLSDGTYLIAYEMGMAIIEVPFAGKQVLLSGGQATTSFCELFFAEFSDRIGKIMRAEIETGVYTVEEWDPSPQYKYIKLK